MAAPSYTYTLANSTTADADEVMQNFNDILNGISDGTKDLSINALTVAGAATFNGNVQLGNATGDTVSYTARVASDIVPSTSAARNLGSSSLAWIGLYLDNGATDGGAVYFDASSSKFWKANAAGTEMELSGFTTLDTNGAQQKELALYGETKSSDYTITDTDGVSVLYVSTGSSDRTMTLPTAADNTGRVITFVKTDSGSGDVIIDGEGAETINGSATLTLVGQYKKATIICDGSAWYRIASTDDESGLWTPNITGSGGGFSSVTYVTQSGVYYRTGNMVLVTFTAQWSAASGGTGNLTISGLPFTANSTAGAGYTGIMECDNLNFAGSATHVLGSVAPSSTTVTLVQNADNSTAVSLTVAMATTGSFNKKIRGSIVYYI